MTASLPFVDEHTVPTDVSADRLWAALLRVVSGTSTAGRGLARVLATDPASATPAFRGEPGDTVPGFRVVDAEAGHRLVLAGRHRFSDYRLEFTIDERGLHARTDAAFPGVVGRAYRFAVIGTGGHRMITRLLLRRIVRVARAEPRTS